MPPPVDLSPERESWLDQLKQWGLGKLPGRMARVMRIALGVEGGDPTPKEGGGG